MVRGTAAALAFVAVLAPCTAHAAGKCTALEQKHAKDPDKLDPLLKAADCHMGEGRFVLARLEFGNAERIARARHDAKALKTARDGIAKADGKVAWVTISAESGVSVSELRIDGQPAQVGLATPLDPGVHSVEARYSGGTVAWSRKLELKIGDTENVVVPPNPAGDAPAPPPPPPPPPPPEPPPHVEEPAQPAPADKPVEPAPLDEDAEPPHTGFVFDLVQLLELYKEVPQGETSAQAGHAWVTVAMAGWDFTPSIRVFMRYGIVANIAPERSDALSASNAALGARYTFSPIPRLRLAGEGGFIFPIGSGAGSEPHENLIVANGRARALYPTLFDPNYMTPWLLASASPVLGKAELRLDTGVDFMFRTSGEKLNPRPTKIRLVVTAHAGYRVLRQLVPYAELRYFRFLNDQVLPDASLIDNMFGVLGLAVPLAPALPVRLSIAYVRALDDPLSTQDFQALTLGVGGEL